MHPPALSVNTEQAEGKGVGQPELQEEQQRLEEEQRQQEQQQLKQEEENEQQRQQQRAKQEELEHIVATANATAAAVMVNEVESASTMEVATQQNEIAEVLPQSVVVSAVASPITTPAVAGRIRKSDYEKMSARLLEAMEASEKDWPAKDLLEWYITEHASDQDTTAREEISQQLEHVLRRMIKHDKSVVDVKSTVKGSKRLEDKVLRTKYFANKLHAEHLAAKKAEESAAAAAIAAASEAAEKERLRQVAEEEAKEQARLLAVKAEELERIVATANATAAAVMVNEVESASTMEVATQQNEIAEVLPQSVVVSAVASPITTPAVAGRIRKSDYEKMSARLLEAMEASEKDWPAKDLLEWYITEHASDQDTTAREEISQQLEHVLRRMIKHDKSVVDVKSTVKGSKRLEDKVLRTKYFANKLHAEHLAAKKAEESAAAAAIAAASEAAEKERLRQVAEEEAKEQARLLAVKAEEDALVEAELNRAREAIIKAEEHERHRQELHHQAERRREEKERMERKLEAQVLSEKAALAAAALEALAIKMDEERKHAEAVAEAERIRVQLETERMARQLADEQAALKAIADADAAAAAATAAKALEEEEQRRQKARDIAEQEKLARELVEQEEREKIARKLVEQEQEERKKLQEQQAREQAAREEEVSPSSLFTLVTTPHSIYLSHPFSRIPFPYLHRHPAHPSLPLTYANGDRRSVLQLQNKKKRRELRVNLWSRKRRKQER